MQPARPLALAAVLAAGLLGLPWQARAALPQPSCDALAAWSAGFDRREGWLPNALGLGPRERFNALFATPDTAALFGRPVLDWTAEEARALAPHVAACAEQARRAGNREANAALGALRGQLQREVPHYLAALAEARAALPQQVQALAAAPASLPLLRFALAVAAIGSEDGAAARASQALGGLPADQRNALRGMLPALRDLPEAEIAPALAPVAAALPALRAAVREAALAELAAIPASLAGVQMLDRRAQQLGSDYPAALGEAETRLLEAGIAERRAAIGAALRDDLLRQVAATPPSAIGLQMLQRLGQQVPPQAPAVGAEGVREVQAALAARQGEIGAALLRNTLDGMAELPAQATSLRMLRQIEAEPLQPLLVAAIGPGGVQRLREAAAARRAALGAEIAGAMQRQIAAVMPTAEAFEAIERIADREVLALLPEAAAATVNQAAAARRTEASAALLPAFRRELARLPETEEGLDRLARDFAVGIAAWPRSAAAEQAKFAALIEERHAAILAAITRAEAGPLRGRVYEGAMLKIEFLDRTRVVLTGPGAPPVPGTYTEERDGRVTVSAGQMSMVMTREGRKLVAGPLEVTRVR